MFKKKLQMLEKSQVDKNAGETQRVRQHLGETQWVSASPFDRIMPFMTLKSLPRISARGVKCGWSLQPSYSDRIATTYNLSCCDYSVRDAEAPDVNPVNYVS